MMKRFFDFLRHVRIMATAALVMQFSACTYIQHTPVPEALVDEADIPQFGNIRAWADDLSPEFIASVGTRHTEVRKSGLANKPFYVLALSGGGQNVSLFNRNIFRIDY